MESPPTPQFKGRSKPRMAFTSSEKKALLVLAGLFVLGLVLLQVRRVGERDLTPITIHNAERLESLPQESPVSQEPHFDQKVVRSNPSSEHKGSRFSYLTRDTLQAKDNSATAEQGLIDLNSADTQLLESLPGIGPVLAKRIVDYRNQYGAFLSVKDLLLVKGIGDKRLENLLPHVTVK